MSATATTADFIKWIIYYVLKRRVLARYLKRTDSNQFSNQLNSDQYFIILMIAPNVNDITANELATEMYLQYSDRTNDDYIIVGDTRVIMFITCECVFHHF